MAEVKLTISAENKTGPAFDAVKNAFDQIKSAAAKIVSAAAFEELIRQSTLAAQEAEAYSVSLKILGQNVGYSSDQLDIYVDKMAKLNYTQENARSALSRMIETNISLSNSTKLATIAQDASTVSHQTATEALDIMNFAISTGMTRSLKHMGIIVDFTAAEQKYAEAHGTSTAYLTVQEQMQIRVNEVERAAVTIHGAYAESLDTAAGIMKRLAVTTDETKDAFGKLFLPTYKVILSQLLDVMKDVQKWFEDNPDKVREWGKTFLGSLYDIEAEVVRVSMLLDKMGGTMTWAGMALFGPGAALGIENSVKQFEKFAQANIDYQARYEEGEKRLIDLATKRNALDNPPPVSKSNEEESAAGGADAEARDAAEKNRLIMKQNEELIASYWKVNDAVAKITGSNEDQAKAQEMVYFSSKEYLDLVKTAAGGNQVAQAILDEQKHLHSLQGIDAVYKDLAVHLSALKELQGMSQEIQAMDTSTMTDPFAKQQQALQDSYVKQMQDTENFVSQKQSLLDAYDKLGIKSTDQRYKDEQALIQMAKDKELGINKQYAYNVADLDLQIAMAKAQVVSTSIGQVGQLMMTGNKHEFEEGKTLAETEAAINAALAIIKAYGQLGPIYGAVAAVGIGALLDKEINTIESQQYTGKADGGLLQGGIPGKDSIHVMAMEDEYIVKAPSTRKLGVAALDYINEYGELPHFADGGVVGSSSTDSSSNVVDLATYKAQKAQKEQLEATDTLIDAVQANTTAVTKVADGLTKIAGVFDSVANYFSELPGVGGDAYSSKRNNELSKIYNTKGDVFKVSIDTLDLTNTLQDLYTSIKDAFSGESSFSIDTAVKDSKTLTDIKSLMQNAGIMGGSESITSQGIQLGYSGGSLQAGSYANITTEGGWFSNDSFETQTAELDASLKKLLDDTVADIKDSVANAAAALGQTADGINSVTMELTNLDLSGMSDEEATAAVEAWLQDLGNAFASGIDGLDALVQPGENSYDALIRLAGALQTVNDSTTRFGGTAMEVSLTSADAASSLVDLMGGLDAFTTAADNYFSKFYTSAEQASMTAAAGYTDMSNALAAVGYSVPATSAEFRDMVNSLDLTTEAGQDAYAAFMSVTDGAAAFYDQAKAVADATKALNDDLTVRAYTAAGLDADASLYQLRLDQIAEVKKAEEDGLLTTEQITQLKIVQEAEWAKAVEDASATVSAAAQALVDSAQTALENMLDLQTTLLNKWKSLSTTDSSLSPKAAYDAAQTAFADASKPENWADLPAAIDQLLSASEAYNAHGAAYQADRQAALDILATAGGVSPDTTMEQVDEQITLLEAIKTALTDGTLADNSELINQLGPNSTLQGLIATWSEATKTANDTDKVAAASQAYGKAYDKALTAYDAATTAYEAGGSLEDYTKATQSTRSTLGEASREAYTAGVTSFTSAITGQTYDFGQNWATLGALLIGAWAMGDHSGAQPDLQYDIAGKSPTDMTPNGIIDMNDLQALMAIYSGASSLPTHHVGSSFIPYDHDASLQYGEAVIDAQSNAVLQKYGIKVQASGGNNDALIAEIRALRKEVKDLKDQVEKQGTAQVKVLSNGFMKTIEQGDEQNKTTKEMASKTRLASLNAA